MKITPEAIGAQEFLKWNRSQKAPLVVITMELGIFRKAIEFYLAAATGAPMPCNQPQMVLVPHYRGYANLGTGQYLMNHSEAGSPPEFIISVATDAEKSGRVVGDSRENASDALLMPDAMAVRIAFSSAAGLDAMESQLRKLRAEHFPQRECNSENCNWAGLTDRMLGAVGPLCPQCGETTEPKDGIDYQNYQDCQDLLSLAAKAVGIVLPNPIDVACGEYSRDWNPLENDGDALRLAMLLGLTVSPYGRAVFVSRNENEPMQMQMQMLGNDIYAATRRAIVCAAAEIGKIASQQKKIK